MMRKNSLPQPPQKQAPKAVAFEPPSISQEAHPPADLFSVKSDGKGNNFKVVVRVRPQVERETGTVNCLRVETDQAMTLLKPEDGGPDPKVHTFGFDRVFDHRAPQQILYDSAVKPVVLSVLEGYNGSIIAYGQTGTGKTFTIEGSEGEHRGIIPRSSEEVFDYIEKSSTPQSKFLVRASFLQIYNEKILDLLDLESAKRAEKDKNFLKIREDPSGEVYVDGLSEHIVKSPREIIELLHMGSTNRTTASTKMNRESSRSHAVFTVIVERSERTDANADATVTIGRLNLVDLAGSERLKSTGVTESTRIEEMKKINASLSAFGNVIRALTSPGNQHIPYRDSKLTRILQSSLGGNCKTTMITNVTPSSVSYAETLNSLKFANRAKNVKNFAMINQDMTQQALLSAYEKEIAKLRHELESHRVAQDGPDPALIDDLRRQHTELAIEKDLIQNQLEARAKEIQTFQNEKQSLLAMIQRLEKQLVTGGTRVEDRPEFQSAVKRVETQLKTEYERKFEQLEREREELARQKEQFEKEKSLFSRRQSELLSQSFASLSMLGADMKELAPLVEQSDDDAVFAESSEPVPRRHVHPTPPSSSSPPKPFKPLDSNDLAPVPTTSSPPSEDMSPTRKVAHPPSQPSSNNLLHAANVRVHRASSPVLRPKGSQSTPTQASAPEDVVVQDVADSPPQTSGSPIDARSRSVSSKPEVLPNQTHSQAQKLDSPAPEKTPIIVAKPHTPPISNLEAGRKASPPQDSLAPKPPPPRPFLSNSPRSLSNVSSLSNPGPNPSQITVTQDDELEPPPLTRKSEDDLNRSALFVARKEGSNVSSSSTSSSRSKGMSRLLNRYGSRSTISRTPSSTTRPYTDSFVSEESYLREVLDEDLGVEDVVAEDLPTQTHETGWEGGSNNGHNGDPEWGDTAPEAALAMYLQALRHPTTGVRVGDRRIDRTVFRGVFTGHDAALWFIDNLHDVPDVETAIGIGQKLMDLGMFSSVQGFPEFDASPSHVYMFNEYDSRFGVSPRRPTNDQPELARPTTQHGARPNVVSPTQGITRAQSTLSISSVSPPKVSPPVSAPRRGSTHLMAAPQLNTTQTLQQSSFYRSGSRLSNPEYGNAEENDPMNTTTSQSLPLPLASNSLTTTTMTSRTSLLQSQTFSAPLTQANQDIMDEKEYGATLLHSAAGHGDRNAMKTFLQTTPVNCLDHMGRTPLMYACIGNKPKAVEMLVKIGASLTILDANGRNCLLWTSYYGHHEVMKYLLKIEPGLMVARDQEGRTALHWSTKHETSRCLELLLKAMPRDAIDAQDVENSTALHWSVLCERPDHTARLLKAGANASLADHEGRTPLHYAVSNVSLKCLKVLIDTAEYCINDKDLRDRTALHLAICAEGSVEVVSMLLQSRSIDVNCADLRSTTPLHWAAACGRADFCLLLMNRGAKISFRDNSGMTPLHYATQRGFSECANVLQKHFLSSGSSTSVANKKEIHAAPPLQKNSLNIHYSSRP